MSSALQHHLIPTLCGVICEGSQSQIGNSLDFCSGSILRHLGTCTHCKQCFTKKPNACKVTRSMIISDASDDEIIGEVVKRVVGTKIIPGLIMAITLQKSTSPNGRTIISVFIAVRSIKKDRDRKLQICSPNKISQQNQLLGLG